MFARLAGVVPGPEDVTDAPGPEDALAAAEAELDAALDAHLAAPTEAAKRAAEERSWSPCRSWRRRHDGRACADGRRRRRGRWRGNWRGCGGGSRA
jgi:hypothetical protein